MERITSHDGTPKKTVKLAPRSIAELRECVTAGDWNKYYKNKHTTVQLTQEPLHVAILGVTGTGKSSTINTLYRTLNPDDKRWQKREVNPDSHTHGSMNFHLIHASERMFLLDSVGSDGDNFDKEKTMQVCSGIAEGCWNVQPDEQSKKYQRHYKQDLSKPADVVLVVISATADATCIEITKKIIAILKSLSLSSIVVQTRPDEVEDPEKMMKVLQIDTMSFKSISNYTHPDEEINEQTERQALEILDAAIGLAVDDRINKIRPRTLSIRCENIKRSLRISDKWKHVNTYFGGYAALIFFLFAIIVGLLIYPLH